MKKGYLRDNLLEVAKNIWIRKVWNDKISIGTIFKKIGWIRGDVTDSRVFDFLLKIYYDEENDVLIIKKLDAVKIAEEMRKIGEKNKEE